MSTATTGTPTTRSPSTSGAAAPTGAAGRAESKIALGEPGIDRLGVDPVPVDGLGDRLVFHVALSRQRAQRGDDDVGGVDLEVTAQRFPRVREAVAVGAE